jgi:hypothetical protein
VIPPCFREVWFLDTEFFQPDGERPSPICLVGREHYSGDVVRLWLWGEPPPELPFDDGRGVLFVCYAATAEWSVYLALGWPLPVRVLDLHAEYRWLMSGFKVPRYGQLDAMAAFGLPCMDDFFKQDMRSLCRRGGPFTAEESREILAYCEEDVNGLAALFGAMEPHLQWPQALARGRYTVALASVESASVPLDRELYPQLRESREAIRRELIEESGEEFGTYDGTRFDSDAFERYLVRQDIPWPRTSTGRLVGREETFEEMVDIYPQLRPLYELRSALNQLKEDGGVGGRVGRQEPRVTPAVHDQQRPERAVNDTVGVRQVGRLPQPHQTRPRLGGRLRRLLPTGIRNRRRAERRPQHAAGVPER